MEGVSVNRVYQRERRMHEFTAREVAVMYNKILKWDNLLVDSGCVVCLGQPKGKRPVVNHKIADRQTTTLATQVVLELHAGPRPGASYTASHLCGIPRCIRPDHLVWEPHWYNVWREGCHRWDSSVMCPHKPECLPYRPDIDAQVKLWVSQRKKKLKLTII